jgi:putative flippase GtrA
MKFKKIHKEFACFVIVGIFATVLHYGIYYLLMHVINVNVAYTIGYFLSFIVNFFLTSYFTFGVAPSWMKLLGMSGAHLINYLLHMILLNVFLYIGISKVWAPLPVFSIAIPINFILVRFAFKKKK